MNSNNERHRLSEIARLALPSIESAPVLSQLVQQATESLHMPVGLVCIVLDGAQFFIAHSGLDGWMAATRGTPREWSFCDTVVRTGEDYLVDDATQHQAVADNPLVLHDGVRSYAGSPLTTASGAVLGTVCVVGGEPRNFTEAETHFMHELATKVVDRLEERAEKESVKAPGD